ncbi:Tctex-1 [Coniochaeta sp. 2T2.1]|nr:Tctex-1 [Coniochaeta sp. 2T2.1]
MATSAPPPVALKRLEQIASDVCTSVFGSVETYDHPKTMQWNQSIIEKMLRAVTSESEKPYKLAINSTIVQHNVPTSSSSLVSSGTNVDAQVKTEKTEEDAAPVPTTESKKKAASGGRRGMHSATGGYWNEKTDGMWSYKYEGDEKGFDVVIMLIWVGI